MPDDVKWDDTEEVQYPTTWHIFNALLSIEVRQLSEDTYQLRSPSHELTLNKEGFTLYRDDTPQGEIIFNDWCKRNKIESVPRELKGTVGVDDES